MGKITFALYFANRGFFPGEAIGEARTEMEKTVSSLGFGYIEMEASLTRFGAVETQEEGYQYARFLKEHEGEYDGVIMCLPNFGDENGALKAMHDCKVPILLQAYPDEIGVMDFSHRRDAFCGKISIADTFRQAGIKFTVFPPHTCRPSSDTFCRQLVKFAQVCAVVKRMRDFNVGAFGARTTAFKTVRFDELALQAHDINCETIDMYQICRRMKEVDHNSEEFKEAYEKVIHACDTRNMPDGTVEAQAALYVTLKRLFREFNLGAAAIRCWPDLQDEFRITPCMVMGLLHEEHMPVACEMDVCNALAMAMLNAAADLPPICMDWNNNYSEEEDECILFHCGSIPESQLMEKGTVISHKMLDKGKEELGGVAWGCKQVRVRPGTMTYMSAKTETGRLTFYVGRGEIIDTEVEKEFFGCPAVIRIPGLQRLLLNICKKGYRHHVSMVRSDVEDVLREAITTYLGYEIDEML